MLKLLIADGTEEFVLALSDALQDSYHIRTCSGGKEVLSLLRSFTPDMLVLDMMLPELDGISLLQQAAEEGLHPTVLVTSRFFNDYILEALEDLKVGYVMRKPCDIRATIGRLQDLSGRVTESVQTSTDFRTQISALLLSLGFATRLKGYACLREAILLMMEDPGQSITKELYPEVGRRVGGNKVQAEHAIRGAIAKTWDSRDAAAWATYFPANVGKTGKCPTNKEFICRLADSLSVK